MAAGGTLTLPIGHDCKTTSDEELAKLMSKTLGHMRVRDVATLPQPDFEQPAEGTAEKTCEGGESARSVDNIDGNDDMGRIDHVIVTRGSQAEDLGSNRPDDQENDRSGDRNDISREDDSLRSEKEVGNGEDIKGDVMSEVEDATRGKDLEEATEMEPLSGPGVLQGKLMCVASSNRVMSN